VRCDTCQKKKASVHLVEATDDQISEIHLCEECARKKSIEMEQQFGLADLLAGLAEYGGSAKSKEKAYNNFWKGEGDEKNK